MKILMSSHYFLPSIGGLENVSAMLAEEFVRKGHEVRLVTQTTTNGTDRSSFQVFRRPSTSTLLALTHWSDIYLQNSVSLRTAWPLVFVRRPWVVAHQTWIPRSGPGALHGRLKHFFLRFATSVSISHDVANHVARPSVVIPNPYDDGVFHEIPTVTRDRDLVFVGRLVSDKGPDLLLRAIARLKSADFRPQLTIVGAGPEDPSLRAIVKELELQSQVFFAGVKRGRELAELLNRHKIMVVPSLFHEPFGIVALEGIACGCVVVGSEGGGLKDAIGSCGITFPNGDEHALATRLSTLLTVPEFQRPYRTKAAAHLSRHTKAVVAEAYIQVLKATLDGTRIQSEVPRPATHAE